MTLTILYGTQTGSSERLSLLVARMALKRGCTEVRCLPADATDVEDWEKWQCPILFVCSNANQGEAPDSFRNTWCKLLDQNRKPMPSLTYAVFGVGDSIYRKYNYMGKMLHNRLQQLGAKPLVYRGLGDESDIHGIVDGLMPWLTALWPVIGLNSHLREENANELLNVPLFPFYKLKVISKEAESVSKADKDDAQPAIVGKNGFPLRDEPTFPLYLKKNVRLTSADHFQAVHHLEFATENEEKEAMVSPVVPPYQFGDALGVYCPNTDEKVNRLLGLLQFTGEEIITVSADRSNGLTAFHLPPFVEKALTLRYLFTHYIDLDAVTTQDFLWMLSELVTDTSSSDMKKVKKEDEEAEQEGSESLEIKERLRELADLANVEQYLQFSHREKRNIVEVLEDFKMIKPPLELILTFATVMRPRLFSISSSPLLDGVHKFHLTVAQLKWESPLKRQRTGLCSNYLVNCPVETKVQCFVWQGSLTAPASPAPLLCVATGSGIAPLRSLMRSCAALKETWGETPLHLFFGCRYPDKDFLYAKEWEELREKALPCLKVYPAFSRLSEKKHYVQHQLGERASMVGKELLGSNLSVIYVCGNAKQMPNDVSDVLEQISTEVLFHGEESAAQSLLKKMHREGRYQVDTWSA